ncbi:NAD-binding protein [Streptomyces sp. NPDC005263]|uniref:NAD-binding protein n=1 Tax=Streptomyces sp. NPDC005263 TaxID=3364711 RepID=UPI0036C2CBB5
MRSAVVIGAGFLGMEVATACAARGIPVTVLDVNRPLERIIGSHLSAAITERAATHGIRFLRSTGFAALAGDPERRAPFWSNAVGQGKVAAASALKLDPAGAVRDDYFWTEIAGLALKVVGPLPPVGEPTTVDGSMTEGRALLTWQHPGCRSTVVAYGLRKPVSALRVLAGSTPLQ